LGLRWKTVRDSIATENAMSKTDTQLKRDIEEELRWDPKVNAAQIAVSVNDGTVWLIGAVDTYAEKWSATEATRRVSGVRVLAEDLTVRLLEAQKRTDADIADAIRRAFEWNVYVPDTVTAKVKDGAVTLAGQVAWNFQREAAERSVRDLAGIIGVHNTITLTPGPLTEVLKENVEHALRRQAKADARSISIETSAGRVILSGHASSWQSIKDAKDAAWATPGVTEVVDHMTL
jgi:osmotically-inducible protein OsmY